MKLNINKTHEQLGARRGSVTTSRGTFQTPVFMPVGTRGPVKTIAAHNYKKLGSEIILGNTYHLMIRPGADVVEAMGGLGKFTSWDGLTLTDSGGFQVFSLKPKLTDEGVKFKSTYDGTNINFTPENAVEVQEKLGADIQMVLDVCSALPASYDELYDAMIRTHNWAKRAKAAHQRKDDQALFGIVQGGDNLALRIESAKRTRELDFDGYAIGGLSVGESRESMIAMLDVLAENDSLPKDQPRYLMGVGDPIGIIESIMRGIDMFDCVLPSRLARHGVLLTWQGKVHIKREENKLSDKPIDDNCECEVCSTYSRSYLRHLVTQKEMTAGYLCTLHNISWMHQYIRAIRNAIETGEQALFDLKQKIIAVYT
ncbi:MAG: tRNA guanosine(34) transglycosylase Tgt [Acidimicrobiia bacterium]|nr:tRNA guanosine(34) transglycosylase Tgt [Acidimicrobiia bacterium]